MGFNDDFYGKGLNLNCFHMHTILEQKYPKPAIVYKTFLKVALSQKILENFYISNINIPNHYPEQKI